MSDAPTRPLSPAALPEYGDPAYERAVFEEWRDNIRKAEAVEPPALDFEHIEDPREAPSFEVDDRPFGEQVVAYRETAPVDVDEGTTSAGSPTAAPGATPKGPSQATRLLELAEDAELFHAPAGDPYAVIEIAGHRETWPVRSAGFRDWLRHRYFLDRRASPSAQAMTDALGVLEARARFEGATVAVAVRIAGHEGRIYLDLADRAWRAVEIAPTGWRVVTDPPVRFRRPSGLLALPEPVRGGRLERLREGRYVNVTDDASWRLLVGFLLAMASPAGPYPVLLLTGEQGSAKSTAARVLRALVDPSESPLRAEPREVRDLLIAARNGWLVALDNLSALPGWLSDALCRLATGGGFATRTLYSNDEETILDAQRPTIVTGITDVATRGDLLDRAITVELPRIPDHERRLERDLWVAFEMDRPEILGALLDAVAGALARRDEVRLARPPRMADFAAWVTAAEPALGWHEGAFLDAYAENRATAHELALDGSAVAGAIRELLPQPGDTWEGTSAELLERLAWSVGGDAVERLSKRKSWPTSPRGLAGDLRRLAPNLRATGIEVIFGREAHTGRRIITLVRESREPIVTTVTTDPAERETGDGRVTVVTQRVTVEDPIVTPAEHEPNGGDGRDGAIPPLSNGLWDDPDPPTEPDLVAEAMRVFGDDIGSAGTKPTQQMAQMRQLLRSRERGDVEEVSTRTDTLGRQQQGG